MLLMGFNNMCTYFRGVHQIKLVTVFTFSCILVCLQERVIMIEIFKESKVLPAVDQPW